MANCAGEIAILRVLVTTILSTPENLLAKKSDFTKVVSVAKLSRL